MLSRTLASRALLVSGKPTICLIFLDVLFPTTQEFCPDAFRGSSALVWGSQICDISACGVPDVMIVAIPDVDRAHRQWYARFPEITALSHATCYTGNKKPSNNCDSLQKGHILFLSVLLTHLCRDGKIRLRTGEEKNGIDIKFSEIVASSRVSIAHQESSIFWCFFCCS